MFQHMLASAIVTGSAMLAQADDRQDVLEKFRNVRPQEADLAIYGLDWSPTLKDAKERAAREHRPVFLILVTNSFGNIYTGHC